MRVTSTNSFVSRWRYVACLLLFTVVTVYVSLFPWTRGKLQPPDPWSLLTATSWLRYGFPITADVVLNVLFYLPFGVFGVWSLPLNWGLRRVPPVVAAGAALSFSIEVAQFYHQRVTSPVDLATNTIGVMSGAMLGWVLQRTSSWTAKVVPALLLACWLIHVLLAERARMNGFSTLSVVLWAAFTWLLVAFVDSRTLSRFACWTVLTALAGLLLWEELRPFSLIRQPEPFEWRPFIASIQGSSIGAGAVFSRKLFHYGATLFAMVSARVPLFRGTAVLCLVLFLLEQVQRFLPGRTPEITDSVLVLLWALIFRLVLPSRAIV